MVCQIARGPDTRRAQVQGLNLRHSCHRLQGKAKCRQGMLDIGWPQNISVRLQLGYNSRTPIFWPLFPVLGKGARASNAACHAGWVSHITCPTQGGNAQTCSKACTAAGAPDVPPAGWRGSSSPLRRTISHWLDAVAAVWATTVQSSDGRAPASGDAAAGRRCAELPFGEATPFPEHLGESSC